MNPIKVSLAKTGEVKVSGRKKAATTHADIIARKAVDTVPYFTELFRAAADMPQVDPLEAIRSAILANPTEVIVTLLRTRQFKPKEIAQLIGYNTDNKDQQAQWTKLYNDVKWHFMCRLASEFVEARVPASYEMDYQSDYGPIKVGIGTEVRKLCLHWLFRKPVMDEYAEAPRTASKQAAVKQVLDAEMSAIDRRGELRRTRSRRRDRERARSLKKFRKVELAIIAEKKQHLRTSQSEIPVQFKSRTKGIKATVPAKLFPWAWAGDELAAANEWIEYGKECRREYGKVFSIRDVGDKQSTSMLQASAMRILAHLIPKK
jgi:hypothetical protein